MSFFFLFFSVYLHPASLHVCVVDYCTIYSSEHKKQGSANADSSLTTSKSVKMQCIGAGGR